MFLNWKLDEIHICTYILVEKGKAGNIPVTSQNKMTPCHFVCNLDAYWKYRGATCMSLCLY